MTPSQPSSSSPSSPVSLQQRLRGTGGPTAWGGYGLVGPALFLFGLFIVFPMIGTLVDSLHDFGAADPDRRFVGLGNYAELVEDPVFWGALKNNLLLLIGSVVVQVGGGVVLAAVLHRGIRRGRAAYRAVVFAPMIMSVVAVGLLWQLIYYPSVGILNRVLTAVGAPVPERGWLGDPDLVILSILIVACWQYLGFMMVIMLAGMQSIPSELYEAARLEGAGEVQAFRYITVPGIRNVILIATLITMIGAFKVFDLVYVLTLGGPANASQVLGLYLYQNAFTLDRMGYASALAVVLLLIALGLGLVQLRLERGKTASAL